VVAVRHLGILKLKFLTASHFRDTFCVITLNFFRRSVELFHRYNIFCVFQVMCKNSLNDHSQAATALCATPAFLYRCSSTITAPFPSPFMATIYKPPCLTLASLHFFQLFVPLPLPPSLPSILPLSSTPSLSLPFLTPLSLSYLEDIDDDAFLDCSHEYCGLQSDIAYSLSGIFCDALLPPHYAVNWS